MKDDRGELDLTKQIDNLKEQVDGYKALVELQKSQLWELRQSASQLEKTKNLLQGYQKVIQDLSYKLRRKDS
jgi:prefoldin subunit 5|tara:strand:+ start:57 stop:272 length:216 start_codon:yes stop_codon:yes gene_type:complete